MNLICYLKMLLNPVSIGARGVTTDFNTIMWFKMCLTIDRFGYNLL